MMGKETQPEVAALEIILDLFAFTVQIRWAYVHSQIFS